MKERAPMFFAPPGPRRFAQARVAGEELLELVHRERVEQLDRAMATSRALSRLLVADDVVVDLAAAQAQACDLFARAGQGRVVDHALEATVRQLLDVEVAAGWRSRLFGVMTTSGRCLATSAWAPQKVEVLRRRRAVGDADVPLGAQLQEALQAAARVLGTRALVAVGEQPSVERRAGSDTLQLERRALAMRSRLSMIRAPSESIRSTT